MGDLNKLPSVEETTQPVSLEETNPQREENLEPVEIDVTTGYQENILNVTNNVQNGIYLILGTNNFCSVIDSTVALKPSFYELYEYFTGNEYDEEYEGMDEDDYYYNHVDERINGSPIAKIGRDPSESFSEKRVRDQEGIVKKVNVGTIRHDICYGKDFDIYNPINMNDVIVLTNGKFLIHGCAGLSFISEVPAVDFQDIERSELNFDEGSFSVLYGDFFTSKKGTNCFRILPKEEAKHVLIKNYYYTKTLPEEGALYYKDSRYGVYDKNFKNEVSEEDI